MRTLVLINRLDFLCLLFLRKAAWHVDVSRNTILASLQNGVRAGGYYWRYVEKSSNLESLEGEIWKRSYTKKYWQVRDC